MEFKIFKSFKKIVKHTAKQCQLLQEAINFNNRSTRKLRESLIQSQVLEQENARLTQNLEGNFKRALMQKYNMSHAEATRIDDDETAIFEMYTRRFSSEEFSGFSDLYKNFPFIPHLLMYTELENINGTYRAHAPSKDPLNKLLIERSHILHQIQELQQRYQAAQQ